MRRSEIFDNFVKIAQEKGLVAEDAPEKAKKKLESNPRADSQSIKDIEALYGVKPDAPKGMEYKRNIIEDAHPESVVISPSYDKLNGLVENNNERQDIILNIVNKQNNGQLTNHKYAAEQELLLSLVRLGNELDNNNNEELRVLADTCLEQLSSEKKKLVKSAAAPVAIIAGVAAIFGSIYLHQHMPNQTKNFKMADANLSKAIHTLLESDTSVFGMFGIRIEDNEKSQLQQALKYMESIKNIYYKIYPYITSVTKPRDAKQLLDPKVKEMSDKAQQAAVILQRKLDNVMPWFQKLSLNYKDQDYTDRVTSDQGSLNEFLQYIHLEGSDEWSLFSNKFRAIANAIPSYLNSIKKTINILNGAKAEEKEKFDSIQEKFDSIQSSLSSKKSDEIHLDDTSSLSKLDEKSPEISEADKNITELIGG